MRRRLVITAVLFALFALLCSVCAYADDTEEAMYYVDENNVRHEVEEYELLKGSTSKVSLGVPGDETWYAIKGTQTFTERIETWGTVNLILCEDADVTCEKSIIAIGEDHLVIWGQVNDDEEKKYGGKLLVQGEDGNAAIGGLEAAKCGTIDIHSGDVHARTNYSLTDLSSGAAIGSGAKGQPGTVNIFGGNITAEGGHFSAGIGGGDGSVSGIINISGGTLNCKGTEYGAAIGSGDEAKYENEGKITITGGTIKASGGNEAAAIGGGNEVSGGEILITGTADLDLKGGYGVLFGGGAAIGGGDEGGAGDITISGGTIIANGEEYGAGIGTGADVEEPGKITITGGIIYAKGGLGSAGIGGGNHTDGCEVHISGGDITAEGTTNSLDQFDYSGAGIGGGSEGNGGKTYISGGKVKATGGPDAAGIGGGDGDTSKKGMGGYIEISGDAYVEAYGNLAGSGIGSGEIRAELKDSDGIAGGITRIYGGTVIATGGSHNPSNVGGAGIGTGRRAKDDTVAAVVEIIEKDGNKIHVEAQGGCASAGIGGGDYGNGALVTIDVSDESYVIATGGDYGAGIGSGDEAKNTGSITIENGNVGAFGGQEAAGIGGGNEVDGGAVTINGGTVYTEGGAGGKDSDGGGAGIGGGDDADQVGIVTINGGFVSAKGFGDSAGIGGGEESTFGTGGAGGPVVIKEDATVLVTTVSSEAMPIGNAADDTETRYSLSLYDTARVTAGANERVAALQLKNKRIDSCHTRANNWVKIEKCGHDNADYTVIDAIKHRVTCRNCEYDEEEEHVVVDGVCEKCGFAGYDITFEPGQYGSGEMAKDHIDPGTDEYTLPECGFTPVQGKYFIAWGYRTGGEEGYGFAGAAIKLKGDAVLEALWGDQELYGVIIDRNIKNGTVKTEPLGDIKAEGETVELIVTPDENCVLETLTYTKKSGGDPVDITEIDEAGHYTFKMPADYVTVTATFLDTTVVTGVTVEPSTVEISVGETAELKAVVSPETALNKNVTWTSSDDTVAAVDENGKVTGVKEGTAVITATTEDGGKTATCDVTVKAKPEPEPEPEPEEKKPGASVLKLKTKGSKALVLTWNKVTGADGYDIFFSHCNKKLKKVKTIKAGKKLKWTKKGLKKGMPYKARVKAFVNKDGKKQYIFSTPDAHAYTNGGTKKYTNAKSVKVKKTKVSLKAGKNYRIKASVVKLKKGKTLMQKGHAPKLRYLTTDKAIAKVTKKGVIKGVNAGTCYIYVYSHNGISKKITVTIK